MKKFLSLVLALIMVMSLVTVGAGAVDFKDADKVQYTEAVELMTSLGILKGYDNGYFAPQDPLSRAAGAKITAYIALGKEEAEALSGDEMPFTDVRADSSMRPFIAWAAEQGIINGTTPTTFEPSEHLGGHAFLKMVLGALKIDGVYTGSNWRYNVTINAENAGLLDGIDTEAISLRDDITRELACQIAFNAMKYVTVVPGEATTATTYKIGGMTFTDVNQAAMYKAMTGLTEDIQVVTIEEGTLLKNKYGVTEITGIITANKATGAALTEVAAFTFTAGKVSAIEVVAEAGAYNFESGVADLGKVVTVYFDKTGDKGVVSAVVEKSTTVTVAAATEADTAAEVKALFGNNTDDAAATLAFDSTYDVTNETAIAGFTKNTVAGVGTYVLYNGEIVAIMAPVAKYLTKVLDVDDTADAQTISLQNFKSGNPIANGVKDGSTVTDYVNEYEGIAKNDVVVVTVVGDIYNLEKAQTVTGKATKIDTNKGTVTIGETTYTKLAESYDRLDPTNETSVGSMDFATEYTLYLDGKGNFFVAKAVTAAAPTSSVVFYVTSYDVDVPAENDAYGNPIAGTGVTKWFIQCIDLEGNIVNYETKTQLSESQGLFKVKAVYDEIAEQDYYEFDGAPTGYTTKTDAIAADAVKVPGTAHYFNADVKFISFSGSEGDLEVVVNEGVKAVDATYDTNGDEPDGVVAITKYYVAANITGDSTNKKVAYVFVDGPFAAAVPEATDDIVFANEGSSGNVTSKVGYTDADGEPATGFEHTVYIDGEKTTIITTTAAKLSGFITLTEVVEGVYETGSYVEQPANLKDASVITNMYNGLMTTDSASADDTDVTGVTVVNTTSNTKVPTDATKLSDKDTVALVYDEDVLVLIYVTASSRS